MKVVIVGGVAGGAGTAARLRRNDEFADIVLFEKDLNISFANCGLPYYAGGVIHSKETLLLQTPESFRGRFNVDVRVNQEVISVDTVNKTVKVKNHITGELYEEGYDKLALSPGASPIRPKLPGIEGSNVFTVRNIPDIVAVRKYIEQAKPKTCVVVGGGFIGMEMAENIAKRGITVTIVEAAPHIMPPMDMDMCHEVHNYVRSKGVGLALGSKCEEITSKSVLLDDKTELSADMVIISIGISPSTGFLKDSGIELGQRGEIIVDEFMRTSVKDVYALGDAASVKHIVSGRKVIIPLASPANKQGRITADNISGREVSYAGSQGTSIMKFFDMAVAVTGLKEEALKAEGIKYLKSFTYSASHAGYYPGGDMMAIKLLFTHEGKILGAQITGGKGVDKRIDSIANAIRFGLSVYDLQEMELAYAPPFSTAKDPVNMAGYVAGNILEGRMIPFYASDVMKLPRNAYCVDVRSPDEYKQGHIPGFINIPLDSLREELSWLKLKKEIYLTCQIGLRGYIAQRILMQNGVDKVKNLAGGYRAYMAMLDDYADTALQTSLLDAAWDKPGEASMKTVV